MRQAIEDKVRHVAEPILGLDGYELVDVEFLREQEGWILRLYIDRQGGVGIDDCMAASRSVETAIEVENVVPHEYHLEVSSPGLNRPLKKIDHFQKAVGQKVRVKTAAPLGDPPRKNFVGTLVDCATDAVDVEVEGAGRFRIPLKDVTKANVEYQFPGGEV